jgi:hypothetical protein
MSPRCRHASAGSGKTLAFLVPLVLGLVAQRKAADAAAQALAQQQQQQQAAAPSSAKKRKSGAGALQQLQELAGSWQPGVKALVVSPTHELAAQQMRVLTQLIGGSGLRAQQLTKATAAGSDWGKVDVLIANPLRALSLVEEGKLGLGQVRGTAGCAGAVGCCWVAWFEWPLLAPRALCALHVAWGGTTPPPLRACPAPHSQARWLVPGIMVPRARPAPRLQVRWLVLDEADKLFEMGFLEQVDGLLAAATHPDIVRALFSATLPEKVGPVVGVGAPAGLCAGGGWRSGFSPRPAGVVTRLPLLPCPFSQQHPRTRPPTPLPPGHNTHPATPLPLRRTAVPAPGVCRWRTWHAACCVIPCASPWASAAAPMSW